jgi:REP element-mobilizing transposase RayT
VLFTATVFRRECLFRDDRFSRLCVSHLLRHASLADVAVTAYCLMPDHAHALLEGRSNDASTLDSFVAWKRTTAKMARARLGVRLWRSSFFDRVLRGGNQAALDAAAYVLANPVRAGLTRRIGEYQFAGSEVFTTEVIESAVQHSEHATSWRCGSP